MRKIIDGLKSLGCKTLENESMARHSAFKTGGAADVLCLCHSGETAQKAFFYLSDNRVPFTVMGGGSNILVSDRGYKGVVLKFLNDGFFKDCGGGYFHISGGANACRILPQIFAKGYGGGRVCGGDIPAAWRTHAMNRAVTAAK